MSAGSSLFSKADEDARRLALAAFVFLAATSSRFPFPDDSAEVLAQHLRLLPFPSLTHLIWGFVARALGAVSPWSVAFLPNLFSAVCGAAAVAFLYSLVKRMDFPGFIARTTPGLSRWAGIAAGGYLMVCVPFWWAANRAYPATFDVLWLLATVSMLARFRDTGKKWLMGWIAGLISVGALESATMLWMAPLFFIYMVLLARARRIRVRRIWRYVLPASIPAVILAWAVAISYAHSDSGQWREVRGWAGALWVMAREAWLTMKASAPNKGWLLLLFGSFLPWVCCAWMPRESNDATRRGGSALLYLVVLGVSAAVLLNFKASPWRLTGLNPLLVTPYVFSAASFGYAALFLVGYLRSVFEGRVQAVLQWGASALLVAALLAAAILNFRILSARGVAASAQIARVMVAHGAGRDLLFTDGLMDAPLLLAARDGRVRLRVVNQRRVAMLPYRRYVASLTNSRRLQALARSGFTPFVSQWIKSDTNLPSLLAIQNAPDLWISSGVRFLPHGSVYLGGGPVPDVDAELKFTRDFCSQVAPMLERMRGGAPAMRRLADALARHFSSVANDFGVLSENRARDDAAEVAYRAAISVSSNNLSSHLNLWQLAVAGGDTKEAASLLPAIERLAREQRMPVRLLVDVFGHVRTRTALNELTRLWGQERGAAEAPPASWAGILEGVARGGRAAAKAQLEQLLRAEPRFEPAWVLAGTMAYEDGDRETLLRCLRQMRSEEKDWPQLLIILGRDAVRRQMPAEGRQYFERANRVWPENVEALEELVRLDMAEQRFDSLSSKLDHLLTLDPKNALGNFCLGALLFRDNELGLAEESYRLALATQRYPPALNNLAWLLQLQGRLDEALAFAREAVQADPASGNAWDTLGVVHLKLGRLDEAEQALAMALRVAPSSLDAQVHVLQVRAARGGQEREAAKGEARNLLQKFSNLDDALRAALNSI